VGILLQSLWNSTRQQASRFQPGKLLLIWAVFIFAFFSVSSSKLPSYILPIFPALALLIAIYMERPSTSYPVRGLTISSILLGIIGLLLLGVRIFADKIPALNGDVLERVYNQAYLPWLSATSILMIVAGLVAFWLARHKQRTAIWVIAWAGFLSSQLLMLGHEPWGRYLAGTEHLAAIQAELTPETPLYAVGRYEQALPFYLRHTTILVEHPDELEFGLEQEPQLWISNRTDFVNQWRDDQAHGVTAMAIIQPAIYAELLQQGVPMRIITQDPRRVIVSSALK
jgi:4-amino-4-deoxy-L-arabinose transferase-like glycosyltransferase